MSVAAKIGGLPALNSTLEIIVCLMAEDSLGGVVGDSKRIFYRSSRQRVTVQALETQLIRNAVTNSFADRRPNWVPG